MVGICLFSVSKITNKKNLEKAFTDICDVLIIKNSLVLGDVLDSWGTLNIDLLNIKTKMPVLWLLIGIFKWNNLH